MLISTAFFYLLIFKTEELYFWLGKPRPIFKETGSFTSMKKYPFFVAI